MTVKNTARQTLLLTKKNLLLKRRRPIATAFEIFIPVLIALFFYWIRSTIDVTTVAQDLRADDAFQQIRCPSNLTVVPDTATTRLFGEFASSASVNLNNGNPCAPSVTYVSDEDTVISSIVSADYDGEYEVVVIFESTSPNWEYTIRVDSNDVPDTGSIFDIYSNPSSSNFYTYTYGDFSAVQRLVDEWILLTETSTDADPGEFYNIYYSEFPHQEYVEDSFWDGISTMNLILILAFLMVFLRSLKSIVEDKETKIKEGLKMNGVSEVAIWGSWFLSYALLALISSILTGWVLKLGMLRNSSYGSIFLFLFLFQLSLIAFAFMCSSFFSKAKSASNWGTFLFFIGYIVSQFVTSSEASKGTLESMCLLSTSCFIITIDIYAAFEAIQVGVIPENYGTQLLAITYSSAMGLLFFDICFYMFLAWYFSQVLPSEFGIPQPFYFLFLKSYWCPSKEEPEGLLDVEMKSGLSHEMNENIQQVSEEQKKLDGVHIEHLVREFKTGNTIFRAVNDVVLDIYEGEVFALLGHNGAGKTTTISMLTGLIGVTSGDAHIFGKSISANMDQVHDMIGVCPQVNVLYDILTVTEHLMMFAQLRGYDKDEASKVVEEMIDEIGLREKAKARSSTLSGGQKRKLSVAIAFIGDPKVVFLDEPTSGMDVHSRRSTWEIIRKFKKGRVIILTTHFMDEADLLGDRIAIMSKGEVVCCGTPLFLKNRYGVGYTMVVTRSDDGEEHKVEQDNQGVIDVISEHVDGIHVLNDIGNEIFVQIPFTESAKFPNMFRYFDDRKEQLGILNYAISVTTMEEVFLKVGEIAHSAEENARRKSSMSGKGDQKEQEEAGILSLMKRSGQLAEASALTVYLRHSKALLLKRFHHYKRDRLSLVFQVLIPSIFMINGLIVQEVTFQSTFTDLGVSFSQYDGLDLTLPYYELDSGVLSGISSAYGDVSISSSSFSTTPSSNISSASFDEWLEALNQFNEDIASELLDIREADTTDDMFGALLNVDDLEYAFTTFTSNYSFAVYGNYSSYHAYPGYLNGLSNGLLQDLAGSSYSIKVNNHPRPLTVDEEETVSMIQGFIITFYFMMAAAMIPGSFVTFIVSERQSKSKHQQMISGVSIPAYWITNYIWDSITYLIPFAVAMILLAIGDNPNFIGDYSLSATVMVFLLFGWSIIPLTYLISMLFKTPGSARGVVIMIYFLTGLVLSLASFIMDLIESTQEINGNLKPLYRIFPVFCFGDSLYQLSLNFTNEDGWSADIVGTNVKFMIAEIFIYLTLTILVEYALSIPKIAQKVRRFFRLDKNIPKKQDPNEDEDVAAHRMAIERGDHDEDQVLVKGLRKIYGGNVAVKDMYLAMPQGQCFGFLGINGAGKTTTLSILSGDIPPTEGEAKLAGLDVLQDQLKMRRLIGYCPQFDALFELLTGREHLEFYARVKGVPENTMADIVDGMLHYLSLDEYADRPAGTYSGGNKRKLSVAMALIGDPPIVFLDEPSTGMDPVSRRFMWKFISDTMSGRVVVLTTHSMEECEALCNRLGIMVSGRLRCIGTPQHLKSRFGQGYQLDIGIQTDHQDDVEISIKDVFPNARLIEKHSGIMKFKIPFAQGRSLADIFELVESNKDMLHIEDYSVGQTTLEQIFIYFAQQESKAAGIMDSDEIMGSNEILVTN